MLQLVEALIAVLASFKASSANYGETMTGFEAFWQAWPSNTQTYSRKGCKAECRKRWIKHHHETQAEQIVKHIEWLKTCADWLKDGGAYIPAPLVYLNQQRWDGADIPTPKAEVIPFEKTERYRQLVAASIAGMRR
jgi:hypothetical protein